MPQFYTQENAVFKVLAKFKESKTVSANQGVGYKILPYDLNILTCFLLLSLFIKKYDIRNTRVRLSKRYSKSGHM